MKKKLYERDIDECAEKIKQILKEYNCYIEFDIELEAVIIVDKDTLAFERTK